MRKKEKESLEKLIDVVERLDTRISSIEKRLQVVLPPIGPLKSEVQPPFEILQSVGTPHTSTDPEIPIRVLSSLSSARKETLLSVAKLEEKGLHPTAKGISELTGRPRNQESDHLKRLWQLGLLSRVRKRREMSYRLTDATKSLLS